MSNEIEAIAGTFASSIASSGKTLIDAMYEERNVAPKDYFGPLPYERRYAEAIEGRLTQYNEGLISSLELFSFMYLEAFKTVE